MNKVQKIKKDFIKEHLFERKWVSRETFNTLTDDEKVILDDYYHYYKVTPIEITDAELQQYLSIRSLVLSAKKESHLRKIKGIMVFWLTVTIINLIGVFYMIFKLLSF